MTDVNDISELFYKLGNMKRQNLGQIETALDDAEIIRETAQEVVDADPWDGLDNTVSAFESLETLVDLGMFMSPEDYQEAREALDKLVNLLPGIDYVQELTTLYDEANDAMSVCRDHKENPRQYETDEKQSARDDLGTALEEFATALDNASAITKEDVK